MEKVFVNRETLQMIEDFSNANAPSGFEDETVKAAAKHIGGGYETEEDCLRNFYMYRKANTGNKPVFMLDAHGDEVGFMVQYVRDDGLIRYMTVGGIDPAVCVGKRVLVGKKRVPKFCVSCQHYSFAVNAFVEVVKEYDADQYGFILRETQTGEIIDDVASGKSELGLLYLSESNETVLSKLLRKSELVFEELFTAAPACVHQ